MEQNVSFKSRQRFASKETQVPYGIFKVDRALRNGKTYRQRSFETTESSLVLLPGEHAKIESYRPTVCSMRPEHVAFLLEIKEKKKKIMSRVMTLRLFATLVRSRSVKKQ